MNPCTHTQTLSHTHMARRRGGALFGHQVRRLSVLQVQRPPMNRCGSFSALRPYVRCSVFFLIHHRGLYLCPCPCLHLRLCLSVYPVLVYLLASAFAHWHRRVRNARLSLSTLKLLSIYMYTIFTHRRVRNTRLWMTCLWT